MAEALATYLVETFAMEAITASIVAYAVVITASVVVSKALASQTLGGAFGSDAPNPGSRQQIPPAGDNKLPVIYGSAWVGGTITDLSISENNQELYFVLALSEVTNTESGGTPDTITFGDIYYGGKKVTFQSNGYTVASLTDESTGEVDTTVAGKIEIYLYKNGSQSPVNSTKSAIEVLSSDDLIYKWNSSKLMSNCAFAIIHLSYSQTASVTSLQQTKFQVINSRTKPGDCIYDFMTSSRYGASIPVSQIDTASISALNAYSDELITYTTYSGFSATLTRFKFDGAVDTTLSIMQTFQLMASSCDCLIRYNEINAKWAIVVQSPIEDIAMDLNDSNMVSSITVSPMDISNTFNVIECKYPDGSAQDSFASVTYDLAQIDPSLLFANEPVNKQSLSLYFVNNNVRVQLLANRFLKAAREDLQIQCKINYSGIQLEAGDIVTVTNANYGWTAKPFRVIKVTEEFLGDGMINASLNLTEYNATVYDDVSITEFEPADNTGIGDPTFFGTIPAPTVINQYPTSTNPLFLVQATTSSSGITQYAEIWYSAFSNPTSEQRIFAGTTEVQSNGNPYNINTVMPAVSLANIPSGNWYFFSRMVNSLASSNFSPASLIFRWRPSTYQYSERYLNVAYADNSTGTSGFSFTPTSKLYYGLFNSSAINASINPTDYTWYLADPAFGSAYYLCYSNRTGRKFSFATGLADNAAGSGAFVPTLTTIFDPSTWSALPNGTNYIDLDVRTGQLLETGTTTVGTGEIAITNSQDGRIVASLQQFLDFGTGVYTYTGSAATLTIDIYGRVVGFTTPDNFYYTEQVFTATAGQTIFTVTRAAGYIAYQCLVFQNGLLLDESEYTDTSGSTGTVTLTTGATLNDVITIVSMKSSNTSTGVYASFTRNQVSMSNQSSVTPVFTINSGYELLFVNGTIVNDQDYDIIGNSITNFPALITGDMTVIQWSANNLGVPNGTPVNIATNTVIGQSTYSFSYNANSFNLYGNGVLFKQGTDYTTATGSYTLANTPDTVQNIMVQQTFARTGAV